MRTLKEIWQFATGPKPVIPPGPDQLAVAFASALMMSGRYENAGAAIIAAWWAVPEFYQGRAEYEFKIAPLFFSGGMVPNPAGDDKGEEYTVRAGHDVDASEDAFPAGA